MFAWRFALPGLLCCAVLLAACGSARIKWSQASNLNTIAAYQAFLSKYPNDVHAADANNRIAELKDAQTWSATQVASMVEGYQQYLTGEPSGAHAQAAREEIETRERAAAWRTAQTNETAQSLQDFPVKYPAGREADAARDKLEMLTGYRADLGTAHSQRPAACGRDALTKRFGKDLRQRDILARCE